MSRRGPALGRGRRIERISSAAQRSLPLRLGMHMSGVDSHVPAAGLIVPEPEPEPSLPAFPSLGVSIDVLEQVLALCGAGAAAASVATTSCVCHEIVRQLTVPAGWADNASITNPEKGYYAHEYVRLVADRASVKSGSCASQSIRAHAGAPPGTRSYAKMLAADPATRHMVGTATCFVSHAWQYRFRDLVAALRVRSIVHGSCRLAPRVIFAAAISFFDKKPSL